MVVNANAKRKAQRAPPPPISGNKKNDTLWSTLTHPAPLTHARTRSRPPREVVCQSILDPQIRNCIRQISRACSSCVWVQISVTGRRAACGEHNTLSLTNTFYAAVLCIEGIFSVGMRRDEDVEENKFTISTLKCNIENRIKRRAHTTYFPRKCLRHLLHWNVHAQNNSFRIGSPWHPYTTIYPSQ